MKKLIILICAALFTLTLSGGALASSFEKVIFQPGSNRYIVNDNVLTMDAAPFTKDGRIYMPVTPLASALGAESDLSNWDETTGTVNLVFRGDSKTVSMDAAPILKDGRIYLPARRVAEACGFKVEWDSNTQSVLVYAPVTQEPTGKLIVDPPATQEPIAGLSVDTREIKSTTDQLELNLEIPVISGLENKVLQEKINKEILDKAMQTKSELENSYQEYAQSAREHDFPAHPFQLYVDYETYISGHILSLAVETYQFTGGAHGLAWRVFYNLDTKNGQQLSLEELYKDTADYKTIINREIQKQINQQITSDQGMYFDGDMGFKSISDNHPFYIKDGHIVICFGQYEIAPYAAGMPEFQVPGKIVDDN
jgi:hypothetical protein